MKQYSERLSKSPARAIQEFYVAPRMETDRRAFPVHMQLHKAHVTMLAQEGIIPIEAARAILQELLQVEAEGVQVLKFSTELNDVYLNLQMILMDRLGEHVGGWIHAAMSRNDYQMAQARIAAREQINACTEGLLTLSESLLHVAREHTDTVMPGYTHHSQQAQPITLGHFLLAAYDAFARDLHRLAHAYETTNFSPMGGAALSTTGFPINREKIAEYLGFAGLLENSLDATGSRDFVLEAGAAYAIAMSHMGRLIESLLLWNTAEFGLIELADEYCHISSIMPQKKNPVTLEIIRAEAVEVQDALNVAFGILKAVPFGNGREPGYVEEVIFEAGGKLAVLAPVLADVIRTLTIHKERMLERAGEGFGNMTELADAIVRHTDLSFHQAYVLVSRLVARVHARGEPRDPITAALVEECAGEALGCRVNLSDEVIQEALDPVMAVRTRTVTGGPAPAEVRRMLTERLKGLERFREVLTTRRGQLSAGGRALAGAIDELLPQEVGS